MSRDDLPTGRSPERLVWIVLLGLLAVALLVLVDAVWGLVGSMARFSRPD